METIKGLQILYPEMLRTHSSSSDELLTRAWRTLKMNMVLN